MDGSIRKVVSNLFCSRVASKNGKYDRNVATCMKSMQGHHKLADLLLLVNYGHSFLRKMFPFLGQHENSQPNLLIVNNTHCRRIFYGDYLLPITVLILFFPIFHYLCFLRLRIYFLISHLFNDTDNCAFLVPLLPYTNEYDKITYLQLSIPQIDEISKANY